MSDMASLAGPQNGTAPDPAREEQDAATHALIYAVRLMAQKAAASPGTSAEAKDYATAALQMAQAIVVLDPGLTQQGTPLAHEMAMEQLRQDGAQRLEQAKQAAAAPTPKKRSLRRTPTGYDVTEG